MAATLSIPSLPSLTHSVWPAPNSAHACGFGHVDAGEAAAAASEELHDPEAEDQGSVLLVGPRVIIIISRLQVGASIVGPDLAEGAKLAIRSESVDGGGDPHAEVSAAETVHGAASDASENRLVGTDADTAGRAHNQKHDGAHATVDVRPSGASFYARFGGAVLYEVRQKIGCLLVITVGSTAARIIQVGSHFIVCTLEGI